MIRLLALLAILIGLVAGCSPELRVANAEPGLSDGTSTQTINVGGVERSYRVYRPAGLSAAAPLVVVLHGLSGTAEYTEQTFGWNQVADAARFVVAYPTGIGGSWNTGAGCCGQAGDTGVDDTGFITQLVHDVGVKTPISQDRIYAAGMSNGGMMALALACNTDVFAGIASVSGTLIGACNPPGRPSVIQLHGVNDFIVRYGGGPGLGFAGGKPVPDVDAFWRQIDGCSPPAVNNDGAMTISSASCANGRGVELVSISGGGQDGHGWPPFAAQMIWNFFAAHPR